MNTQKLKAIMTLNGETSGELAQYLGISRSTLSRKMRENGAEFTQSEIAWIKARYNLTADDLVSIFFAAEVSA